jgi:hypothetical protein
VRCALPSDAHEASIMAPNEHAGGTMGMSTKGRASSNLPPPRGVRGDRRERERHLPHRISSVRPSFEFEELDGAPGGYEKRHVTVDT